MNKNNVGATTNSIHIIMDILVGEIAFIISMIAGGCIGDIANYLQYVIVFGVFILIYVLSNKEERIYDITTFFYIDRMLKRTTRSFVIAAISTSALLFFVESEAHSRKFFIIFIIIGYIFLVTNTFVIRLLGKYSNNKYIPRTILAGNKEGFEKFIYFVNKTSIKMNIIGYVKDDKEYDENNYLGTFSDLEQIIREKSIDQVFIMQNSEDGQELQPVLDLCLEMGVTARVVMNFYKPRSANSYVSSVGTYPVVTYHTISFNNFEKILKRVLDIVGAIGGIICSSPFMIFAVIAIKVDSRGPVLFRQTRVGMNGRKFKIFKFRTMCQNAEELKKELMEKNELDNGLMFKMENDPRVTKVGALLRKTSIDELPQFFNVLKGDMSLVGTRPPTVDEVNLYERSHWRRISIKPGITGMWQVSGRSDIKDFDEVVKLDTQYIDHWSVWLDVKIIMKTVVMVLGHKGAY